MYTNRFIPEVTPIALATLWRTSGNMTANAEPKRRMMKPTLRRAKWLVLRTGRSNARVTRISPRTRIDLISQYDTFYPRVSSTRMLTELRRD